MDVGVTIRACHRIAFGSVEHISESDTEQRGSVDHAAPDHRCNYCWLHAPVTKFFDRKPLKSGLLVSMSFRGYSDSSNRLQTRLYQQPSFLRHRRAVL